MKIEVNKCLNYQNLGINLNALIRKLDPKSLKEWNIILNKYINIWQNKYINKILSEIEIIEEKSKLKKDIKRFLSYGVFMNYKREKRVIKYLWSRFKYSNSIKFAKLHDDIFNGCDIEWIYVNIKRFIQVKPLSDYLKPTEEIILQLTKFNCYCAYYDIPAYLALVSRNSIRLKCMNDETLRQLIKRV